MMICPLRRLFPNAPESGAIVDPVSNRRGRAGRTIANERSSGNDRGCGVDQIFVTTRCLNSQSTRLTIADSKSKLELESQQTAFIRSREALSFPHAILQMTMPQNLFNTLQSFTPAAGTT